LTIPTLINAEADGVTRTVSRSHPRTKPPEARRAELMNAAERAFLTHGFGEATIEQITSTAGVAKGTFYLYFSSKDDVRIALGERFAQRHLAKITAAIAQRETAEWAEKLAVWAAAGITAYLELIRLHDILFYSSPPTREGLVNNIVIDHLAELLKAGMKAGAWSIDDPRFTAVFIFSGLHAVVDDAYLNESRINRGRLVRRLQRLCFRAIGLTPDQEAAS
jgi:AcrR family transcriptional regulator